MYASAIPGQVPCVGQRVLRRTTYKMAEQTLFDIVDDEFAREPGVVLEEDLRDREVHRRAPLRVDRAELGGDGGRRGAEVHAHAQRGQGQIGRAGEVAWDHERCGHGEVGGK